MKVILVVAFLALASAERTFFDSKNEFDKAVKGVLENIRTQLKNEESIELDVSPRFAIQKRNMDLTIQLKNVEMKQVDTFSILDIKTRFPELKAKCKLVLPSATVEGEYEIDGVISGRRVSETRTFRMEPKEVEATAFMRFEERNSLQMQSMEFDWGLKDLKVKLENSDLDENEKDEVRQTIRSKCLEMIKDNKRDISQRIERKLKNMANQELEGMSKEEVLEMSKNEEKRTREERE